MPLSALRNWACVALLLAGGCAHVERKPPAVPRATGLEAQFKPEVDSALQPLLEQQRLVGAVVAIVTPQETATWGYGTIERGRTQVPDGTTLFEIGSVSKVFTALLLALAVERGEVKLDAPVASVAPELAASLEFAGTPVRWVDLATHTSGLPRVPANLDLSGLDPYAAYGAKELEQYLATKPLARRPGEKYEYSNLGSGLLGYLLERLGKQPWAEQVRRAIAVPLGLKDTTVALDAGQKARLAHGYFRDEKAGLEPVPPWTFGALAAAGALRSTSNDLAHFVAAALGLVPSPLAGAMAALQVDCVEAENAKMRMALGWHVIGGAEQPIYWKDGGTYGAYAFVAFVPSKKVGLVMLSNTFSLDVPLAKAGFKLAAQLRKR